MINDVVVLENQLDDEGFWRVHLMAKSEIEFDALEFSAPVETEVRMATETDGYHLYASWPMRAPIIVRCEGWPAPKVFMMWNMAGCGSVTEAVRQAVNKYVQMFGRRPGFAFLRALPNGVEPGVEIDGVMVFDAEWMVRKCVAVGWSR